MLSFGHLLNAYLISSALLSSTTRHLIRHKTIGSRGMSSAEGSSSYIPYRLRRRHRSGTDFSMAYVSAPNDEVAKDIANKLVSKRLSACVNIVPGITSIYRWKGSVETESEVLMIIKTRTDRIPDVTREVKASHPYEVFELVSVPIQTGNPDYLKWLSESVDRKPIIADEDVVPIVITTVITAGIVICVGIYTLFTR